MIDPSTRMAVRYAMEEAIEDAKRAVARINRQGMSEDAALSNERAERFVRALERQGYTVSRKP